MTYRFLAAARIELEEVCNFYESRRPGLGEEFAQEIERAIQRILDYPLAWPKVTRTSARCCATRRFPYGLIYVPRMDEILIVAVMHLHRRPGYWRRRLP